MLKYLAYAGMGCLIGEGFMAMPQAARAASPADLSPYGSSCNPYRGREMMAKGCEICRDPDGGEPYYPMYGVAPHECFWRKGPEYSIGQSTLVPFTPQDCFVPDLEDDEDWTAFAYPAACGVFYCPNCNRQEYEAAWNALVARIGPPPQEGNDGRGI